MMSGKALFFLVAFVLGTIIPCYFLYGFIQSHGLDLPRFLTHLFQTNAASNFSSDLLLCSFTFWGFMVQDKKDKRVPNIWVFILINLLIGLSSALPLYMYFREKSA
jgi:Terpene cyclase DEP1